MKRLMLLGLIAGMLLAGTAGRAVADNPSTHPAAAATPSDTVAFLGVSARPVDPALRAQLQLPDGLGLSVQFVGRNSPASDELKPGDILQKMDDQLLVNAAQLQTLVRMHKPGDTVKFTIIRETKTTEVSIKLGETARPPTGALGGNGFGAGLGAGGEAIPVPDPFAIPDVPNLGLPLNGNGQNNVSMAFSDGTYSAHVETDKDGHKQITVKDNTGAVVATGQVDTEEQWKKLPDDVQMHLKVLNSMLFHPRRPIMIRGLPGGAINGGQAAQPAVPVPNTGDKP
jgi:hypothetical protein